MVVRHEAKEWAKAHLKGLFSSPSAPFTANFALDQAGVIKNVERVIAAGASGVASVLSMPGASPLRSESMRWT